MTTDKRKNGSKAVNTVKHSTSSKMMTGFNKKKRSHTFFENRKRGLHDLPPEIRNQIYFLALKSEYPIRVTRRRFYHRGEGPNWTKTPRGCRWYQIRCDTRVNGGKNSGKKSKCSVGDALTLHILRTCKLVLGEAKSILYGANQFVFYTNTALYGFQSMLGDNFQMMRRVGLSQIDCAGFQHLLNTLRVLDAPSRIEIPVGPAWDQGMAAIAAKTWETIELFVVDRSDWAQNYLLNADTGSIPAIVKTDEQLERFNSIFFYTTPNARRALQSSGVLTDVDSMHASIKTAVLEVWDRELQKIEEQRAGELKKQQMKEQRAVEKRARKLAEREMIREQKVRESRKTANKLQKKLAKKLGIASCGD